MFWKYGANLQENIHAELLCNFIEITLRHVCSPVDLLHIFRTPFPKNTSRGQLLYFVCNTFSVQTLLWSMEFVSQINLAHDTNHRLKPGSKLKYLNILENALHKKISTAKRGKKFNHFRGVTNHPCHPLNPLLITN